MVTIVKHEWHQIDSQFAFELTKDILEEIYPDMDEDELETLWQQVENNEADLDEIIQDAWDNDVELEWENQYDDWWTMRKGGYEITYEYGDEDSCVLLRKNLNLHINVPIVNGLVEVMTQNGLGQIKRVMKLMTPEKFVLIAKVM